MIKFSESSLTKRPKADLLVLPFWKEKKPAPASAFEGLSKEIAPGLSSGDFTGKEGEVVVLYVAGQKEPRVVLLGLGESKMATEETLRRAYGKLTVCCHKNSWTALNIQLPTAPNLNVLRGVTEGILHANYAFNELKGNKKELKPQVRQICWISKMEKCAAQADHWQNAFEGVYLARNLVNGNADDVTPEKLVRVAKDLATRFSKVKVTAFNKARIEKEKMGLLLAVNQGSHLDPAFIIIEYKGDPQSKDHTIVVGKGVTYDTGGLNLKPTGSMETMKSDMSGSAVALGTILSCAKLNLKKNVTAVIPSTENSIDSRSFKPGDVYSGYTGKTVEIGNTDAEGRLILADALAYACKNLKPSRIVDFATLTGAIVIALGEQTTGMMSNNDTLANQLSEAGEATFERVWRLPLFEEYKSQLKSDVADIKNIGGRSAGSITAALFLQEFVDEKVPWAHLDIAGTAFLSKSDRYLPKSATGVGVRLMVQFLENI
ncbi:MAG: leucyl aminopeptidase [Waddliaceae bacterium]